ncbi:MAG: sortase [Minisyncoccia bacterium]|jgi:LPXTG-site transpeptidase (sortase) family protein
MSANRPHAKKSRGVIPEIAEHPFSFSVAFLAFFFLSVAFLSAVGDTPNPVESDVNAVPVSGGAVANTATPEDAVRLVAKDIGLNVNVINPSSTDIDVLDNDLTLGAVHYPTSAMLGVDGTVLIFGHSSYLPVVIHQYYKTFDGIQDLKTGEIVSVYSATTEYRYSVTGVRVADSSDSSDNQIPLPSDNKYLTLVTCDSFAAKSNRFIVTATFVGAYTLAQ